MPIKGTIEKGGIIDIIQMISLGLKTGVLNVTDNVHLGAIYFENGKIIYCNIVNKEEKIGDKLVQQGIINEVQLKEALYIQSEHPDKSIGEILLAKGYIDRDTLTRILTEQVEDSLFTILTWKEGKFNFEPNIKPLNTDVLISFDVNDILLREGKKIDEWSVIERYIPSFDSIPEKIKDGEFISTEDRKIFELIDGRHSIDDIIEELSLPRFSVAKTIMNFIKQGYVKIGDKRKVHIDSNLKKQIEETIRLSIAFFAAEMYDESLEKVEEILSLDPLNTTALFHKSRIKIIKGEYDGLEKDLKLCLEKGLDEWFVYNNLGIVYENLGEYMLAEEYYLKALTKADGRYRGMLYANMEYNAYKSGRFTDAIKYFNSALENNFESPMVYLFAANTYIKTKEYDKSVDVLGKGISKFPASWHLHYTLGVIWDSVGSDVQAEMSYRQALKFIPEKEVRPLLTLANYYYKKKDFDNAIKFYELVIKHKKDTNIFLRLGNIAFQRGKTEEARKWWQEVLTIDPDNKKAKKNLMFLLGRHGR